MPDFRSSPSETPEGKGRARRAWDAYSNAVGVVASPLLDPTSKRIAMALSGDLLGFWLSWHLNGGFEGLVESGMHPSTVWRKVKRFRTILGVHPDEFRVDGVSIDPAAFWDAARRPELRGLR